MNGRRYGALVVTGYCSKPRARGAYWFCTCDCGAQKVVRGKNLASGNTVSCGDESKHPRMKWAKEVHGTGATFEEIAKELGISKSLARAELQKALRKLRHNINVIRALKEYY
jgi:hypothetical protein